MLIAVNIDVKILTKLRRKSICHVVTMSFPPRKKEVLGEELMTVCDERSEIPLCHLSNQKEATYFGGRLFLSCTVDDDGM